jgi:hypothetical protein
MCLLALECSLYAEGSKKGNVCPVAECVPLFLFVFKEHLVVYWGNCLLHGDFKFCDGKPVKRVYRVWRCRMD